MVKESLSLRHTTPMLVYCLQSPSSGRSSPPQLSLLQQRSPTSSVVPRCSWLPSSSTFSAPSYKPPPAPSPPFLPEPSCIKLVPCPFTSLLLGLTSHPQIGFTMVTLLVEVVVADVSSLKWRLFVSYISATPYLVCRPNPAPSSHTC